MTGSQESPGERSITVIGDVISSTLITGDYNVVYQHAPPGAIDPAEVDAAYAQLAALPLDTIPTPAPLPSGSRMPLSLNPLFVGRTDDLTQLAAALKAGGTTSIGQVTATIGLGGIGKTQLASEFVHRYGQFFAGGVFWLSFVDASTISIEVAACGSLGLLEWRTDYSKLPLAEQVLLVSSAWQSPVPRLLVFDNCEDELLLKQWRPPIGGCRVLLTSRRTQWDTTLGVTTVRLDVLRREESIALLRKHRPDVPADADDLDAIAAELGDLPLALHLAGNFLAAYRHVITPARYLQELRNPHLLDHPSLQGRGTRLSPTDHELHVARTFALSYERLDPTVPADALALQYLVRVAHFAPGVPIPRELLVATLSSSTSNRDEQNIQTQIESSLDVEDAINLLINLGLLENEEAGALRMHRLLTAFIQSVSASIEVRNAAEQALIKISGPMSETKDLLMMRALLPHLRYMTARLVERKNDQTATLWNNLGYHLQELGDLAEARRCYEQALTIREQVLGSHHPLTALTLSNLGSLLLDQGDYEAARQALERAHAIYRQTPGSKAHQFVTFVNNLAILYQAQGKYDSAHPILEQILELRERDLGPTHPLIASALNNLARSFKYFGNYAAARPLYERALIIANQVYGLEHPTTARIISNLGLLLQDEGDYEAARPLLEQVVTIHKRTLGLNHPDIATALSNLALLLEDQGDYEAARQFLEQALAISEQTLGPNHPNTATTLNNLARLLESKGDYTTARPLIERAATIDKQVLGPDHPSSRTSFNNLVRLLRKQGDRETARMLLDRELTRRVELALGLSHPLQAVRFNTLDWQLVEITSERVVWENELADRLSLSYSNQPPDIGVDPFDLDALRKFYRGFVREANIGIVSVDHISLDTTPAVQTIFKVPQQPHGMDYIGFYTLPYATFSYIIEIRAAEHGITGLRDSLVFNEFLSNISERSTDEPIPRGWFQYPYDPTYTEGILRNQSEDAKYDDQFPDHPLSRVRRYLAAIAQSITIDEAVKNAPQFRGSVTGGQSSAEQRRSWWKFWRK
ncbi:MAG: tetratricopeptide repeat protein [Stigonema ocellatum SAG 48.90 = DSM 106950]|nr:tetratricopeptide repeat protein [Stigonema ocellatum SAG 48.90 = DSM 106950]